MKKAILKIFGVAALAAGMMYNVQVFESANSSDISLATLGSVAVAQSESGGGSDTGFTGLLGSKPTTITYTWSVTANAWIIGGTGTRTKTVSITVPCCASGTRDCEAGEDC